MLPQVCGGTDGRLIVVNLQSLPGSPGLERTYPQTGSQAGVRVVASTLRRQRCHSSHSRLGR